MSLKPVIFADGTEFFDKLGKEYIKHSKGLFILAPSGTGKTHFCNAQTEKHWIDGDDLWEASNAHPPVSDEYWRQGLDTIFRIEKRSDIITMEAKFQGFWIIGASCYWQAPDAVVAPSKETLTRNIEHRQKNNYDGGATLDMLEQVWNHLEEMKKWKKLAKVPSFETIEEAVAFLNK